MDFMSRSSGSARNTVAFPSPFLSSSSSSLAEPRPASVSASAAPAASSINPSRLFAASSSCSGAPSPRIGRLDSKAGSEGEEEEEEEEEEDDEEEGQGEEEDEEDDGSHEKEEEQEEEQEEEEGQEEDAAAVAVPPQQQRQKRAAAGLKRELMKEDNGDDDDAHNGSLSSCQIRDSSSSSTILKLARSDSLPSFSHKQAPYGHHHEEPAMLAEPLYNYPHCSSTTSTIASSHLPSGYNNNNNNNNNNNTSCYSSYYPSGPSPFPGSSHHAVQVQQYASSSHCNSPFIISSHHAACSPAAAGPLGLHASFHDSSKAMMNVMPPNEDTRSFTGIARACSSSFPTTTTTILNTGVATVDAFTPKQWNEFTQQVYVFKHLVAGVTPPPALLLPLINSISTLSRIGAGLVQLGSNAAGGFSFGPRGSIDPEPGRCRRTDGKKWRCGRDVVPDQKYCERHMNRGRHRSRAKNNTDSTQAVLNSNGPAPQSNINLKSAVPVQAQLSKNHIVDASLSRDSQLQFSLVTPCNDRSMTSNSHQNMISADSNGLLQTAVSNSFATSTLPSAKANNDIIKQTAPAQLFDLLHGGNQQLTLEPTAKFSPPGLRFLSSNGGRREMSAADTFAMCSTDSDWQRPRDPLLSSVSSWMDADRSRVTNLSISNMGMKQSPSPVRLGMVKYEGEEGLMEGDFLGQMGNEGARKQSTWVPISWDTPIIGGPLAEVLQPKGSLNLGGDLNLLDGMKEVSGSHGLASPTGVLHKTAFGSYSDSSSSASSPHSSAVKVDPAIGLCDAI